MGTETFQSPEIGTLVYKDLLQQLTKILLNEEAEQAPSLNIVKTTKKIR